MILEFLKKTTAGFGFWEGFGCAIGYVVIGIFLTFVWFIRFDAHESKCKKRGENLDGCAYCRYDGRLFIGTMLSNVCAFLLWPMGIVWRVFLVYPYLLARKVRIWCCSCACHKPKMKPEEPKVEGASPGGYREFLKRDLEKARKEFGEGIWAIHLVPENEVGSLGAMTETGKLTGTCQEDRLRFVTREDAESRLRWAESVHPAGTGYKYKVAREG